MMETEQREIPAELPQCNIDVKRKDRSHISAWKNKEEFQLVYDLIYSSDAGDIEAKERGARWLQVWCIRQNRRAPVCVRSTLAVLEAQIFDWRSQAEGKQSIGEIKHLYSGAFTRFINYITEELQEKRYWQSIATKVRQVGIETYLVELRHLCAHSSVPIAIDVFRRSADYCMNWLNGAYWQRELRTLENCPAAEIRQGTLSGKLPDDLCKILQLYEAVTKAQARGATTMKKARKFLLWKQFLMVRQHVREMKSNGQLSKIAHNLVHYLAERLRLPKAPFAMNAVIEGILSECRYMFEGVRFDRFEKLITVHAPMLRALIVRGYMQAFVERLLLVCEDEQQPESFRVGAQFWAKSIILGYLLLHRYKRHKKTAPADEFTFNVSRQSLQLPSNVELTITDEMGFSIGKNLVLGMSPDSPWYLQLTRGYLHERILNVNQYTRDILPCILAVTEPKVDVTQRKALMTVIKQYCTPAGTNDKPPSDEGFYTVDDVLRQVHKRPPGDADLEDQSAPNRKRPKWGIWESADILTDWSKCPLGEAIHAEGEK